jgi:hypothetical protein
MRYTILLWLNVSLIACTHNQQQAFVETPANDFVEIDSNEADSSGDISSEEFDSLYIVVADTGNDYFSLRSVMLNLNQSLNIPIDTLGRYFNTTKNKIVLPDDDEDEIYAGEYFPRRFPSENLSLEYLDFYEQKFGDQSIALVAGIVETESEADSILVLLKPFTAYPFKIKANVYMGCMH